MDVSVSVIVEEREGERWEGEKREGELERRGEKREGGKGRVEVEGRRRGKELHEYGYCETFTVLYCSVLYCTIHSLYCTFIVLHCTYYTLRTVLYVLCAVVIPVVKHTHFQYNVYFIPPTTVRL